MKEFDDLVDIISRLRKECPWDREQTHESLAKHLIEEAYELVNQIEFEGKFFRTDICKKGLSYKRGKNL